MISTWIANLPMRYKFVLLSVVALMIAAAPAGLVLKESVGTLQFLSEEARGLAPADAMIKLIRLTQEHRGLSAAVLSGDASKQGVRRERQAEVDKALEAVRGAVGGLHDQSSLQTLATLEQDWRTLAQEVAAGSVSAADSMQKHSRLVSREFLILEDVVGASGLALDADAQSYYLITAAFRDMPRLTEKLGQSRAGGTTMIVKKAATVEERVTLANLFDAVEVHVQDMERDISKSGVLAAREAGELTRAAQTASAALKKGREGIDRVVHTEDLSSLDATAYFNQMSEVIGAQYALSDQIVAHLNARLTSRLNDQVRQVSLTVGIMLVMLCLGGWLAITITRLTTRAVADAVNVAQALAKGDLSQALHTEQRDEIGQLVRAMGGAVANLKQTIIGIKEASESVATASTQIAQGNLDLSARTENQASSLQQTASSMEQMSATVSHNAATAQTANQLAQEASTEAARSGETFTQVVGKMSDIQQSSRKIAEINAVIDGIAFQTNILALNAAVEAARAGEQGRGFAVVASEVRSLAQRSSEAAREIKALISSSTKSVDEGYAMATETGAAIERLVAQVQQVSTLMTEIASGSEQQHQGIVQVNQAVNQLDQSTQQNAALVEESSAAATSLSDQAQQLLRSVGQFRLA